MNVLEICILVFAIVLVLFTVIFNIAKRLKLNKRSDKNSFSCNSKKQCHGCPYCDICRKDKN